MRSHRREVFRGTKANTARRTAACFSGTPASARRRLISASAARRASVQRANVTSSVRPHARSATAIRHGCRNAIPRAPLTPVEGMFSLMHGCKMRA